MADHGESLYPQRIGEQKHVADQLVGRIGLDLLRPGRSAIATLVGGDAAVAVGEMRDLVPPGAVAFGKAVEEHERRRIARPGVDHVELDAIGERYALLFHPYPSASIFSIYPAATIAAT